MSVQKVPTRGLTEAQQLTLMAERINSLIDGKADVTGELTLTAGATSTVVSDNKFESSMVLFLTPTTANAAAAVATTYVSARTKGAFTLTHANTGTTDRTFLYGRFG